MNATSPLTVVPGVSPTAAQVEANLNTIAALAGNVMVLGPDGGPFNILFGNALAATNVSQIVADSSEVQQLTFGGTIDAGGTFTLTFGSNLSTAPITYDTSNSAANVTGIQNALNVILGAGNTVVSAQSNTVFTIAFTAPRPMPTCRNLPRATRSPGTAPTLTPSTVFEGAGNAVQTLTLGGTAGGTLRCRITAEPVP